MHQVLAHVSVHHHGAHLDAEALVVGTLHELVAIGEEVLVPGVAGQEGADVVGELAVPEAHRTVELGHDRDRPGVRRHPPVGVGRLVAHGAEHRVTSRSAHVVGSRPVVERRASRVPRIDEPCRQHRLGVGDPVEAGRQDDLGVAALGGAVVLLAREPVDVGPLESRRAQVGLGDDAQRELDGPSLESRRSAVVADEVVLTEDREVAVGLVERHGRSDVRRLLVRGPPATRTRLQHEEPLLVLIGELAPTGLPQEGLGVGALGSREHGVVGPDRRLGRDVDLGRAPHPTDREDLLPVAGHLAGQLVGAREVERRQRSAVERAGSAEAGWGGRLGGTGECGRCGAEGESGASTAQQGTTSNIHD